MFSSTPRSALLLRFFLVTLLTVLLGAAALPAQGGQLEPRPAPGNSGKGGPEGGDGDCEPDRDPEDAIRCGFDKNPFAAILELAVSGSADLSVEIGWSDDPALPPFAAIVILDENGAVVTTQSIATLAGMRTTHTVSGALAGVLTHGPQLELKLEDPFTTPLAPELDFRVTFDCSSGSCAYRVIEGLRAEWVVISKDLMLAIDGAEALSSTDILDDVLTFEPSLEGDVMSLVWQLNRLDDAHPLDADPCTCLWVPAEELKPDGPTQQGYDYNNPMSRPSTPSVGTAGWNGLGAAYAIAMQHTGDTAGGHPIPDTGQTHSEITMDLRCWSFSEWRPESLYFGKRKLQVEIPKVSPCLKSCDADFTHQSEAWGTMEIEAWGQPNPEAAKAKAAFTADWKIDGTTFFEAGGDISVATLANGATTDLTCTHKAGEQRVPGLVRPFGLRSWSKLTTSSNVDASASADAWGFAQSELNYWLESTGWSDCAVDPFERVYLGDEQQIPLNESVGGGALIERWGP